MDEIDLAFDQYLKAADTAIASRTGNVGDEHRRLHKVMRGHDGTNNHLMDQVDLLSDAIAEGEWDNAKRLRRRIRRPA